MSRPGWIDADGPADRATELASAAPVLAGLFLIAALAAWSGRWIAVLPTSLLLLVLAVTLLSGDPILAEMIAAARAEGCVGSGWAVPLAVAVLAALPLAGFAVRRKRRSA